MTVEMQCFLKLFFLIPRLANDIVSLIASLINFWFFSPSFLLKNIVKSHFLHAHTQDVIGSNPQCNEMSCYEKKKNRDLMKM